MAARQRPLSPHLQIYNQGYTGTLSILHRITGVVLSFGSLAVIAWLVCVASDAGCYAWCQQLLSAWYGKTAMFVFSACLVYHLLNGIRHLLWDIGWGMQIETVKKTGFLMVGLAIVLTGLLWWVALNGGAA